MRSLRNPLFIILLALTLFGAACKDHPKQTAETRTYGLNVSQPQRLAWASYQLKGSPDNPGQLETDPGLDVDLLRNGPVVGRDFVSLPFPKGAVIVGSPQEIRAIQFAGDLFLASQLVYVYDRPARLLRPAQYAFVWRIGANNSVTRVDVGAIVGFEPTGISTFIAANGQRYYYVLYTPNAANGVIQFAVLDSTGRRISDFTETPVVSRDRDARSLFRMNLEGSDSMVMLLTNTQDEATLFAMPLSHGCSEISSTHPVCQRWTVTSFSERGINKQIGWVPISIAVARNAHNGNDLVKLLRSRTTNKGAEARIVTVIGTGQVCGENAHPYYCPSDEAQQPRTYTHWYKALSRGFSLE